MTMPTSMEPRPARRSVKLSDTGRCGRAESALVLRRWCLRRAARGGFLEVAEEFAIGREDQENPVLAERALVGLEAAIEAVELGVAREGVRVGLSGGRITLAAGAQRIALGIGEDHGALPFGGRADGGAFLLALRAQAARRLGE